MPQENASALVIVDVQKDFGLTVHIASEACASSEGDDNHVAGLAILRRAVGVWNVDADPREEKNEGLAATLAPDI